MAKTFLLIAAISGGLAVVLGAFGAHGLKGRLPEDLLAVYHTAVEYQFYHTFALLAAGLLLAMYPHGRLFVWSGALFVAGLLIFSGSLYLLVATNQRWLGAVTPLGGLAFIAAWVVLACGIYRHIPVANV